MSDLRIDGAGQKLKDGNGNELLRFTATASAVNELQVTNAATGGNPKLTAAGDDTNVHLELQGKGSGQVIAQSNVPNSNPIGGLLVTHILPVPAGATGNVDVTLTHKTLILDAWLVKEAAAGGGAGTVQLKNGSNAITDAMSIDVADQSVVRAATLDDANRIIAAGGTLRAARTRTASTDETCSLYVVGVRVA